jgi:uroporphyrinogen III methyltransferase/synthase
MVYLVGAGPGDPGLLTVRGTELLRRAQVVVYDDGVNPELLRLVPAEAEVICRGEQKQTRGASPDKLNSVLIAKARAGKQVVRLNGDSPGARSHCGDEAEALAKAQIPFEVIPGVSLAEAVPVVGNIVQLGDPSHPLEKHRLRGQSVVVTRASDQAASLVRSLRDYGADILEIPVIRIAPPKKIAPLAEALSGLNGYDWMVFTSANGVSQFFEIFFRRFQDLRDIGGVRIAAVGPGTAAKIKEFHLQVDVVPEEHTTIKLAEALAQFESIENLRILLLRAEVANPELPQRLEALGAIVDDIACYRTEGETANLSGAAKRLLATGADWITFTSSSTVEHFHARFSLNGLTKKFPLIKLASIGPETSKALQALGMNPTVEANPHTVEGLVEAIAGYRGS